MVTPITITEAVTNARPTVTIALNNLADTPIQATPHGNAYVLAHIVGDGNLVGSVIMDSVVDTNRYVTVTIPGTGVQGQTAIQAGTRGIFDTRPYYVQVVEWVGFDLEYAPAPGIEAPDLDGIATVPVSFSPATILNNAPALIIRDGATLIQARAFTDQFGGDISASGNVVTATVTNRRTGQLTTVVMQLGLSTVTIDGGEPIEIATIVGQPTMYGRIVPVREYDRLYVPVRFFADVLGIPFQRSGTTARFN